MTSRAASAPHFRVKTVESMRRRGTLDEEDTNVHRWSSWLDRPRPRARDSARTWPYLTALVAKKSEHVVTTPQPAVMRSEDRQVLTGDSVTSPRSSRSI